MDEKEKEALNSVKADLECISKNICRIADVMTSPKKWYQKTADFLLTAVGIVGGVFVADQIIKRLKGQG